MPAGLHPLSDERVSTSVSGEKPLIDLRHGDPDSDLLPMQPFDGLARGAPEGERDDRRTLAAEDVKLGRERVVIEMGVAQRHVPAARLGRDRLRVVRQGGVIDRNPGHQEDVHADGG